MLRNHARSYAFAALEAIKPGAPHVHEGGNLLRAWHIRKGDIADGFMPSAVLDVPMPYPDCQRPTASLVPVVFAAMFSGERDALPNRQPGAPDLRRRASRLDDEAALLAFMASDGDSPCESCLRMRQNRRMG